jgi:hypothetical protein
MPAAFYIERLKGDPMNRISTTTLPIPIPSEVAEFATKHGVADYLEPVLEMTRRIFVNRPITVLLDEDPEIADLRHIVFEADCTGMTADELRQPRWTGLVKCSTIARRTTCTSSFMELE